MDAGGLIKKGEYFHAAKETKVNSDAEKQRVMLRQLGDDRYDRFTPLVMMVLEALLHERKIEPTACEEAIEKAVARNEGTGEGVLTPQQEMGLIAELWFLQNILMKYLLPEDAIAACHGPKGSETGFWLPGVHIEVKATGRSSSWVTISSVAQLETDAVGNPLYLFNLCLAGSRAKNAIEGKTLTDYVEGIRDEIRTRNDVLDGEKCRNLFDERLFGTIPADLGNKCYREDHKKKYTTKYRVYWHKERADTQRGTFYVVEGNFPRLRSNYLKDRGLRLTTYDIDLDGCDVFRREEQQVVPLIKMRGKSVR